MTIAELLLPEFDREMASTRKLLEALPEKIPGYKPHEKSMDQLRLTSHVAELPTWIVNTVEKDTLDITPPPGKDFTFKVMETRAEVLAAFDQQVAAARRALAGATDEHLGKPWSLIYSGKTLFTMPRFAVIRSFALNHLIHHRAQLGVYLRLQNRPIPGMYGPSADDFNPFAAAGKKQD